MSVGPPPPPPPPPPAPAAFTVSDLIISPSQVSVSQEVSISVKVKNTGDLEGTYTVTIKINGVVEGIENVTVAGGSIRTVIFTVIKNVGGTYDIEVGGLNGTFRVVKQLSQINLPLIVIVAVAILTMWAFLFRELLRYRRRKRR